jgi:hypothetical protein
MSKTKTPRLSAEIRDEIISTEPHLRKARVVLLGARLDAQRAAKQCVNGLIWGDSGDLDEPLSGAFLDLGKHLAEAANLAFFVQALEQDETVQEAMHRLVPLYAELAQATDTERAAQAAERAAWQERENAKQEALAKAVAAIEAEFANA